MIRSFGLTLLSFCVTLVFVESQAVCVATRGEKQTKVEKSSEGILTGRLLTETNEPAPKEKVYLVRNRNFWSKTDAETDINGQFSFGRVPTGEYVLAYGQLYHQGYRVTVRADEPTSVTLKIDKDGIQPLQGYVSIADSTITSGVVSFVLLDPDPSRLVWPPKIVKAEITEKGQYKISAIQPGRYLVSIQPPFSHPSFAGPPFTRSIQKESQKKQIEDGKIVNFVEVVDIKLDQRTLNISVPDSTLKGAIKDSSGKPVPNLMLFLSPSEVQSGWVPVAMSEFAGTDANGIFRFPHVAPGSYDLVMGDSKTYPQSWGVQIMKCVQVAEDETSVEWQINNPITVKPLIRFSGKTPQSPYMMVISEQYPKLRSMSEHSFISDGEGTFYPMSLTFPSGEYRVFAMTKEVGCSCEASIVKFTENIEISPELVPAGAIRVVLRGKQEDIAGRTVKLWDSNGNIVPRLYEPLWSYHFDLFPAVVFPTCRDGITTIEYLRPGRYELTVEGTEAKTGVTVRANETVTICINLDD